ncbi:MULTISPECIES: hypothetical protein [unclassified Kitasatospora]|uniref:hypothetical protein n=1 Tax=unclassified Kitasatospora TaxID=2633591 RepID=UPI00070A4977|nr:MULTISPECIES: hypothetical protein [unclassified Kitasatospora]KRB69962.1 hypothetical protein ASE03_25165 [Kitasatospora sp. Root187]
MEREPAKRFDPLPGRVGHVAGIESLTLDGRRYYFGFDYTSDLVVSPLIDDPDAMAAFAAEHMRQTDGRHGETYWADLVADAVETSELVWKETEREFTTRSLRADLPNPGSHLLYLLHAASEWDDSFTLPSDAQQAYTRLGFDEGSFVKGIGECLQAILEDGADSRPDERTVVRCYLTSVKLLPGNWTLLFTPLAEAITGRE